uniref:Protein HHL1, chloroplastic n=1 Tax=Opuntia streptacantha TaxID=393608 RepID=A0A7C9CMF4_OPUST
MEVGMSLNRLIRLPMKSNSRVVEETTGLFRHSFLSTITRTKCSKPRNGQLRFVVEAKGKKGMTARQFQRPAPPPLPQIEDDGNPHFVIFVRLANVELWFPVNLISGGTTAKIMVAAKDNFLGKYIYKDTLNRNLAAVIYRDEKEIIKMAKKQHRVLRSGTEFRYGYKIVENNDLRAALFPKGVTQLPTQDQLKTVVDKVKDFFGGAKESFGKLTTLNLPSSEQEGETSADKSKVKG